MNQTSTDLFFILLIPYFLQFSVLDFLYVLIALLSLIPYAISSSEGNKRAASE
jgi:hypothetical protein